MKRLVLEMVVIVVSVVLAFIVNEWREGVARSATVAAVLDAVREEIDANRVSLEPALEYHGELLRQLRSADESADRVVARINLARTPLDTTSAETLAKTLHAALLEDARFRGEDALPPFETKRLTDGPWLISGLPQEAPSAVVWMLRGGLITFEGDTAFIRQEDLALHRPFLFAFGWETAQATQAAAYMDPSVVAAIARARQRHRNVEATADRIGQMLYSGINLAGNLGPLADLEYREQKLLQAYDSLLVLLPNAAPPDTVPSPVEPDSVPGSPHPEP